AVNAPPNGSVRRWPAVPAGPEAGAPPGSPEDQRDQEDDDPDHDQNHAHGLRVDAAAVRVDREGQDRPEGDQDQADDDSHRAGSTRLPAIRTRMRLGGFEPPTNGLEGRRSSTELQAPTSRTEY